MSNTLNIQMVDLVGQYHRLKKDIEPAMEKVVGGGQYINGPEVHVFSGELERYLDVKHVIPCGNGTDALQAALMALDLQPGDEVISSTFSFIASVEAVALLGLKPVLVDVDPATYNIDPASVRDAISERTKAIIPVHLFGQGSAMNDIMQIAWENDLFVIEDAAQSLGAHFSMDGNKMKLGTIGHIGCTSFFPTKNLGCYGDGGACFTNDDDIAEKLRMIVNHGARKKYFNERVGLNSRLDTLQAAVLNAKLGHLDDFIDRRRRAAAIYFEALKDVPFLRLPGQGRGVDHTFNQFTVRVPGGQRDKLKKDLNENGIPSMIYYPLPLHRQPVFAPYCRNGMSLPVAEMICSEVLSLPMHTELTEEELLYITQKIKQFS